MKKYNKIKILLEKLQKEINDLDEPIQIGFSTDNHTEMNRTIWTITFYNIHLHDLGDLIGRIR